MRRGTLRTTTDLSSTEVSPQQAYIDLSSFFLLVLSHAEPGVFVLIFANSDDSCTRDLHVCLVGARWFMGFPDLAARG